MNKDFNMVKVIVFRGKAGVGKTTISTAVAQKLNIPIIRKDDIYDSIARHVESHELRNAACYDILYRIVETNLLCGLNVVVDAGFHRLEDILQFKTWIQNINATFVSLLCICSDENIWAERIKKRSVNPKPNNLITDFNNLKLHYGDLEAEALINEKILDTVERIDNLIADAVLKISKY